MSRYSTDQHRHFQQILAKAHQFNHDRLSYYEKDYKDLDTRHQAGLVYPSFWRLYGHHMRELKALSTKPLADLYGDIATFIDKLRSHRQNSEDADADANSFIESCRRHKKALDDAIRTKKDIIRSSFGKGAVFREFRIIRKSNYNPDDAKDMFKHVVQQFNQQFDPFKTNTMQFVHESILAHCAIAAMEANKITKNEVKTISYDTYSENIRQLNQKGLTAFRIARRVSHFTCIEII